MTIKELLPELTHDQRVELGNYIKQFQFDVLFKPWYKKTIEDGNRVNSYHPEYHRFIIESAAKLFGSQ